MIPPPNIYHVVFEKKAVKQFYNLSRDIQKRITKAMDNKLAINPDLYLKPLTGGLVGLYKFRVGDYRLLCSKEDDKLLVLVLKVKHRREVYKIIN